GLICLFARVVITSPLFTLFIYFIYIFSYRQFFIDKYG
ncbi:uncharacterized protein METZ01_LOCUS235100, partial [marine metagenome]